MDEPDDAVQEPAAYDEAEHDDAGGLAAPAAAERGGSMGLAILAAVGVAILGVAVWAVLYALARREFVGIAVVTGLAVGYTIRGISRRSNAATMAAAAVITAIACVVGSTVAPIAYTAHDFGTSFFTLFGDVAGDWWTLLRHRNALTWGIFVVAVVVAAMSAYQQKKSPLAEPSSEAAPDADAAPATPLEDPS